MASPTGIAIQNDNPGGPAQLLLATASGGASPLGSVLSQVTTGIDGTSTGVTSILAPSGFDAQVVSVIAIVTAIGGAGNPPVAGVGVAAGEDDHIQAESLIGLSAANKSFSIPLIGAAPLVLSGQSLDLGIDTGATYSTFTLTVIVLYVRKS